MGTHSIKGAENKPFFFMFSLPPSVLLSFGIWVTTVAWQKHSHELSSILQNLTLQSLQKPSGEFYPFLSIFCMGKIILFFKTILLIQGYFRKAMGGRMGDMFPMFPWVQAEHSQFLSPKSLKSCYEWVTIQEIELNLSFRQTTNTPLFHVYLLIVGTFLRDGVSLC